MQQEPNKDHTALARLRQAMPQELDAVILHDPTHQFFLTSFPFEDGYVAVGRQEAWIFTDFRYVEAAQQANADGAFAVEQTTSPKKICAFLHAQGVKTLGYEDRYLTVFALQDVWQPAAQKEKLTLVPTGALLTDLRRAKTPQQIAAIKEAQRITDLAFQHILSEFSPLPASMTETDVALELEFFMRKQGAQALSFPVIAVSGENSAKPHGVPLSRVLQRGFLTMDFGCKVDGYCSDMTRTVCLGTPDAEMKRVYQTVLQAQQAALDALHEGMLCRDADQVARDVIDGAGYRGMFGHALGHGVGLHIHEAPVFSPTAPQTLVLQEGDVVTVEPGIYLAGRFGVRIEDMITVQDHQVLDLTHSEKDLIVL